MTKKDYVKVAEMIKLMNIPLEYRKQVAINFICLFQKENPRFDQFRFLTACNLSSRAVFPNE
jgi:hypothetical protein